MPKVSKAVPALCTTDKSESHLVLQGQDIDKGHKVKIVYPKPAVGPPKVTWTGKVSRKAAGKDYGNAVVTADNPGGFKPMGKGSEDVSVTIEAVPAVDTKVDLYNE